MNLLLPLGDPDIELADIEPRLYSGLSRVALGSPILTDLGDGVDYALASLADGPGELTLTYVHPPGAGFSRSWGVAAAPTPKAVIVPLRDSTSDSLTAQILKNDAPWTDGSPVFTHLGTLSEPGDWAVSGWPDAQAGEKWALRYSIGGVHGLKEWEVPAAPSFTVDKTGKRKSAADKFRDKGVLLTIRQPVYSGELRTGQIDRHAFGLVDGVTALKDGAGDRIEGVEAFLYLSALTVDPTGVYDGEVLDLHKGNLLLFNGSWLEVVDPSPLAPALVTILYEVTAQTQRRTALGYRAKASV